MNAAVLHDFQLDMQLAAIAARTIEDRIGALQRLAVWLAPMLLISASAEQLQDYQRRAFTRLAPASVDVYVRHLQAFYRWAVRRRLIDADPSAQLVRPKISRGRPHPIGVDDLRMIFGCTSGWLRAAYAIATFAGARASEIAGIQRADIDIEPPATVLVHGKGGKDRRLPLLGPVIQELREYGLPRAGWVLRRDNGEPIDGRYLSQASSRHLSRIGIPTTLHSMRHTFATQTLRGTNDLLLVRDLLGHLSVATTEIYTEPDHAFIHDRLRPISDLAVTMLSGQRRPLRAVASGETV